MFGVIEKQFGTSFGLNGNVLPLYASAVNDQFVVYDFLPFVSLEHKVCVVTVSIKSGRGFDVINSEMTETYFLLINSGTQSRNLGAAAFTRQNDSATGSLNSYNVAIQQRTIPVIFKM